MELWDTHCHLTYPPMWESLPAVIGRAHERGVTHIVVPAVDRESWDRLDHLAGLHKILPAYGIHPWVAERSFDRRELERRLDSCPTRPVAIGEIGLDFKIDTVDRDVQIDVLRAQLDVAAQRSLPVLLHCRGAFEELCDIFDSYRDTGLRGVVHAFSRGPELARRLTGLGLYLAFGGAITRPRATRPRRSAAQVPLDRVLLETDAPSIGLEGIDASAVEPGHVRDVAAALAAIREMSLEEIAAVTSQNARALFGT